MKIKTVEICNFRSLKYFALNVSDMSVLIGANNSGKSNILHALIFFFQGSEKISPNDVYSFLEEKEAFVSVTVTFNKLNDQERNTFKKYVLNDGTITIKKSCKITKDENNKITCSTPIYNGWIEEPDKWFLREDAFERLSSKDKRENEAKNFSELSPLLIVEGRFTKEELSEYQKDFINSHKSEINFLGKFEETPFLGRQTVAAGMLPELLFIPAIRDLSDETKINSKTLLGKLLLNTLEIMTNNDSDFQKVILEVETAIRKLNDKDSFPNSLRKLEVELSKELKGWEVATSINIAPPDIAKLFEIGTTLMVDDGVVTGAELKGNGLQRAIIFSLIKLIANNKNQSGEILPRTSSDSFIYVIEEAELYLHPHKQREFYSSLKRISENINSQVILSTHSSNFIQMNDYRNLAIICKPSKEIGTIKKQCCEDIFKPDSQEKLHYKLIHYINPDNGEMFFARKVILVEGESEKVVFPYLSERLNLFRPDVTIIDCGSKFNLPFYSQLLNYFEIPYVVIYYEDPMKSSYDNPDKEQSDRFAYEFNSEIEKITKPGLGTPIMIPSDFEEYFSISKNQGKNIGKGLAALKHFQSLNDDEIPDRMRDLLTIIYGE